MTERLTAAGAASTSGRLAVTPVASPLTAPDPDVLIECSGSPRATWDAVSVVARAGRVVLVGMPAKATVDLAPLWHREIELVGAYAYGSEDVAAGSEVTFDLAIEMAGSLHTGRLVSAAYSLDRFEEALAHAGSAGPRGAIKIVFDVRPKRAVTQRED